MSSIFRACSGRRRQGKETEVLDQLFASYDLQVTSMSDVLLSSVLCLHEDDSTFLRLWHVERSDDPDTEDIAVGLLMIGARSTDTTLFCPESIAVVIEAVGVDLAQSDVDLCSVQPLPR
ncbi:hypothetical protein CgunFtcFv8_007519 [Champsocephalus gunnari]|uniref:Uncharacterized protein n=1 Tax=Champsocephalus gunnari TaxID=52237 RepID=A0AAN8CHQ1_CHAGU|nr:hypothetical protein CgunFtcFv8_007519 [Champsocephalus gunnari]